MRYDLPSLIAVFTRAIFYGLYIASLAHTFRWLLYGDEGWVLKPRSKIKGHLLAIAALTFVFTTADHTIAILIELNAAEFIDGTLIIKEFMMVVAESLTIILIDGVLLFRCWLVFEKSWCAVCVPLIFWLANIACLLFVSVHFSTTAFGEGYSFDFPEVHSLQVFYACSFATNLYATSAIAFRIWCAARGSGHQSSALYSLFRIVAGTGILYTSTSLAVVVSSIGILDDSVAYPLCDAINFSMAGITSNLLLIRVGQIRASPEADVEPSTEGTNQSVAFSSVPFPSTSIVIGESSLDRPGAMRRIHAVRG